MTSAVDVANLQPTLTPGQVTSIQTYQGAQFIGISSTLSPGMSGGPTVDTRGRILGTGSFGPRGESQQLNFITSTAEVRRVLADNSVSPRLTAADRAWRTGLDDYYAGRYHEAVAQFNQVLTSIPGDRSAQQFKARAIAGYPLENNGPGYALLVLAAAAVMALIAGVAGVLLLLRRRRTSTVASVQPQPDTEPARAGRHRPEGSPPVRGRRREPSAPPDAVGARGTGSQAEFCGELSQGRGDDQVRDGCSGGGRGRRSEGGRRRSVVIS